MYVRQIQARPMDGCYYIFDAGQLAHMTSGWAHQISSGGFGVVYKGWLPAEYGGEGVAVKWLKHQNSEGKLSRDAQ